MALFFCFRKVGNLIAPNHHAQFLGIIEKVATKTLSAT
jgi:hypothetical protein